jgi:hypothetical protein
MMMDTEMDQPARLETLEDEFTQLKAQNATIMSQQPNILQQLRGMTISTPTPPTITGTSDSKLKLALQNDFSGASSKGCAFLTSCDIYVNLVPHQFADDEKAILWARDCERRFDIRYMFAEEKEGLLDMLEPPVMPKNPPMPKVKHPRWKKKLP